MKDSDFAIEAQIEEILKTHSPGKNLKAYFEGLPEKRIRRALTVLYTVYPGKRTILYDDLAFIIYILSTDKILAQDSLSPVFICSLNTIDFTEKQKSVLVKVVKKNFKTICDNGSLCGFSCFLMSIFKPSDLFKYITTMVSDDGVVVLVC